MGGFFFFFFWKSVKIAFLATLHKWDMFKVILKQCVKVSSSISMTFWLRQQRQEAVCLARPLQGCKEKIGFLTMHLFVNHLQECDRYMAAILNASGVCNVSFLWPSFLWISYSRHKVTESQNHSKTLKMLPQHLREKSVIEFIELLNFIF